MERKKLLYVTQELDPYLKQLSLTSLLITILFGIGLSI